MGDRNGGDHNWIAEERKREKEAVYPRGPRMGRRGVGGDMKKSVTFVRGIENLQVNLQTSPGLEEGDRGETGGGRRRVDGIFNKIEVTTNKGVKKVGKSEKNLQKLGVEGVVSGLEANIQDPEGWTGTGPWKILPELSMACTKAREGII